MTTAIPFSLAFQLLVHVFIFLIVLLMKLINHSLSLIQLIIVVTILFLFGLLSLLLTGVGAALTILIIFHYQKYKLLEVIIDSRGKSMLASPNKMRQEKQDQDDKILQEYLRMKPSRAIDRLLSQYNIEKAFYLYNMLQQKIKRNTTELRSTLTEKYQNLVDCSNLLTTIKVFTDEIQAIQKNISQVFHQDPKLEDQDPNRKKRSIINVIQQKIYQKKYQIAMNMTFQNYQKIDEIQKLYLPMLRIQIISYLEQQIINRKFTKFFISQIIECIKTFIKNLTEKQKNQVIANERKDGELLSLIAQTLQAKNESGIIVENDIIQIIFKCKLLSLHRKKHEQIKEQDNISKFFHDIFQLISQKQKDSEEISHLSAIFCKNFHQIQTHLLETFIVKDKDKTISFRYELYEKLATSQDFMDILQKLYKVISESFSGAPKVTLKDSFMNLWESYYNELIDLLFKRCNPINYLPSLVVDKHKYPKQISKYICSDDLSIQSRIKTYQNQLEFFYTNINKLIKETHQLKSSKLNPNQIIEQIVNLYASKVEDLNKLIADFTQNISIEPALNKLGSLIFLFMFCDQFNTKLLSYCQQKQFQQLKRIKPFDLRSNYRITKKFYPCFYDIQKKQSKWSINFDHFFMKYYNPLLKESKREIIKNIILILLEGTMESMDKDKTQIFLQGKRTKKSKEQKQLQENRSKLIDLAPKDVKPTTFAKKKYTQSSENPQNAS